MSKYDFEVDLTDNSSTGMILKKIQPGSTVLEFGCAEGRMTRYMKEALHCQVYIVEYDKDAFDVAMQYAADGVCDDLLKLSWLDKFSNIEFDAILFVDVLEHLSNPSLAISEAAKCLRPDGNIYVSIPNITHNDVLLKAFENHFDYTKVGLLDDTHIHFWGYDNIEPFAKSAGLCVRNIEATYCENGATEQYTGQSLEEPSLLLNFFNERNCGNIYQFVISLGRDNQNKPDERAKFEQLKKPVIKSHIYVDKGNGFSEIDLITFESVYEGPGKYHAHYVITETSQIRKVRFDPVEGQGCILQNISINQGGIPLPLCYSEYADIKSGILLIGTDPMVFTDIEAGNGKIEFDLDILIPGMEFIDILQKCCMDDQDEIGELKQEIICLTNNAKNEIDGLQRELGAYIELANQKDLLLIEREKPFWRIREFYKTYIKRGFLYLFQNIRRKVAK